MIIKYLQQVDSTHTYLKNYIKNNNITNIAIVTQDQTNGIGSRDNSWYGQKGNLFFSFVIKRSDLPLDLPLQSASIYLSFLLKEILSQQSSQIWLKWPNDFYINRKKIGGTITTLSSNFLICGIGLNLQFTDNQFGYLDINIDIDSTLKQYFELVESKISWKKIFSKYLIEFNKSKHYNTTIKDQKISLKDAILNDDGSIEINNEKVFSLR